MLTLATTLLGLPSTGPERDLAPTELASVRCDAYFSSCTGIHTETAKLQHIAALKEEHGIVTKQAANPCSGVGAVPAGATFESSVALPFVGAQAVRVHVPKSGHAQVEGSGVTQFSFSTKYAQKGKNVRLLGDAMGAAVPSAITLAHLKYCADQEQLHAVVSTPFNEIMLIATPKQAPDTVQVAGLSCEQQCAEKVQWCNLGAFSTDAAMKCGQAGVDCVNKCAEKAAPSTEPAAPSTEPAAPSTEPAAPSTEPSPAPATEIAGLTGCEKECAEKLAKCTQDASSSPDGAVKCAQAAADCGKKCAEKAKGGCFAKALTKTCRLTELSTTAEAAHRACYHDDASSVAELVLIADLKAGDHVLTAAGDGSLATTRVLAMQHLHTREMAPLLTIITADGARLSMTSDHAVYVDGALVAAAEAKVGSLLTGANGKPIAISGVLYGDGEIINAVTAAGTLLASDDGAPFFAASHPIWIAPLVLSSPIARGAINAAVAYVGDASSLTEGVGFGLVKAAASLAIVLGLTTKALKRM